MKTLIPTLLLTLASCAFADNTFYSRHFNNDETNGDVAPSLLNWNHHYGSSATNAEGDPNMVNPSVSIGGTTSDALALTQFRNSKGGRGFLFGSGVAAFAPGAHMFWTNSLGTNTSGIQGENGSSTVETDWGTLSDEPLAGLKLSELVGFGANVRPRNAANIYRFAFQLDNGNWYVDATGYTVSVADTWEQYIMADVQTSTVYNNVNFVPGVSLNTDLDDGSGTTMTVAALNPNAVVTAYGIYVDTDARAGTTDSWVRLDDYYIETSKQLEIPAPTLGTISAGGTNFQMDISSRFSISYTLERTVDLRVAFTPVNSSTMVGNGSMISLTDSENLISESEDAFYRVTTAIDQN